MQAVRFSKICFRQSVKLKLIVVSGCDLVRQHLLAYHCHITDVIEKTVHCITLALVKSLFRIFYFVMPVGASASVHFHLLK